MYLFVNLAHYSKLILLAVIAVFFLSQKVNSQWVQTKGPGGGYAYNMAEKNGVIFAGTLGGVYRTTDNGENWAKSSNGIPEGSDPSVFAVTGNYVYVGGFSLGLYRSSDLGLNWQEIVIPLPNVFVSALFASHDTLYIGTSGAGVIRTTNGSTFENINAGFPGSPYVSVIKQLGQYLYAGLTGNGGTVGVYRTTVNAVNWAQVNNGLITFPSVIDIAVQGSDLLTSVQSFNSSGLFRSTDFGGTWTNTTPVLPGAEFPTVIAVKSDTVFIGTDGDSPYRSTNRGANWSKVSNGLRPLSVFSFLSTPSFLFMGFERGIARTDNNGNSWQLKTHGLTNTNVSSFYIDGTRMYVSSARGTAGFSEGIYYTDDNGENWTPLNAGLLFDPVVTSVVKSGSNIVAGTSNFGVYYKLPSDTVFHNSAGIPGSIVNCLLSQPGYLLAGVSGDNELYKSTNDGLSWQPSNTGFNTTQEDQIYSLYELNGAIYAGGFNELYKSTNSGVSWISSYSGIYPGSVVSGITSANNNLFAATENHGIYKSTNNGVNWISSAAGVPPIIHIYSITSAQNVLFAGTDSGVYRSRNNGDNWDLINTGLPPSVEIRSFGVFNNELYIGTGFQSVWHRPLAQIVAVSNISSAVPDKFILEQNYPNPFNPSTKIRFSIPQGSLVRVVIYDAVGRQVSILMNEDLPAGTYETQWNAEGFASGIYFYKIETEGFTETKRMMLLK